MPRMLREPRTASRPQTAISATLRILATFLVAANPVAPASSPATPVEFVIEFPPSGAVLSNLYRVDSQVPILVTGPAGAAYDVAVGEGFAPTEWSTLRTGAPPHLASWDIAALPNGPYTIRVTARRGDEKDVTSVATVLLANVDVKANARQLDVRGEAVTFTSTLGVAASETIHIKDMAGKVVRTLERENRPPGEHVDTWDGLDQTGRRLPDGQYRWVASFTDGASCITLDRSDELDGDYEVRGHADYPSWDAFDNTPLRFGYTFDRPGEIFLLFARETVIQGVDCDLPGRFCRWVDAYQPAGEFTYEWAGVDDTGAYRPDVRAIFVVSNHQDLAKNTIVLHGGRPRVERVTVSPSYFRVGGPPQSVSFELTTFRGEAADVAISWMNHESLSTLRTLRLPKVLPGLVKAAWDGRADNEAPVALGNYTVAVTACDALRQCAQGQILTRLDY